MFSSDETLKPRTTIRPSTTRTTLMEQKPVLAFGSLVTATAAAVRVDNDRRTVLEQLFIPEIISNSELSPFTTSDRRVDVRLGLRVACTAMTICGDSIGELPRSFLVWRVNIRNIRPLDQAKPSTRGNSQTV